MNILIAEDEPRTARALQRLIHQRPGVFCIGMAMNGEEALAIMEKTPADLVITDGNPFEISTRVLAVYIDGNRIK